MHYRRASFSSSKGAGSVRNHAQPGLRRAFTCFALILALLAFPGSDLLLKDAPGEVSAAASSRLSTLSQLPWTGADLFFSVLDWLRKPAKRPPKQETMAERNNRVAEIRISPSQRVVYLGETLSFTAVGIDSRGDVVQGAKFDWAASSEAGIDDAGRATFLASGLAKVTCRVGSSETSVRVLVKPGEAALQSDSEWEADQNAFGSEIATTQLISHLFPTAHAQSGSGNGADIGEAAGLDDVGSPPYAMLEPGRLGPIKPRRNFSLGVPIANLGGRGLNTGVTLYYNSNVWGARFDQGGTVMTFDPVQSWPSPGFTLGLGRMVYYALQSDPMWTFRFLWVDPDGTRHYLGQGHQTNNTALRALDGSNLAFVGNATTGGTLYYNDGTQVAISRVNNRLLPTQITETNGNYVQIAYKQNVSYLDGSCYACYPPMAIDHITDTLGRVILFNYGDGVPTATTLSSISTPVGTTTFTYQAVTLNTNFMNPVENAPSTFYAIRTVTSPIRPTYTFTYSGYGMIYDIAFSGGGASGSVNYNYPVGGEELFGGATFSQRTESPSSTFSYSLNGGSEVVTRPDGSTLSLSPWGWEIKNNLGVSFSKIDYAFTSDPGGAQQVQAITSYDETGTPVKTDLDYDQYGNVVNRREYGVKINGLWQVRRRTHYAYLDYQQYIDAYIWNRVGRAEVYDALQNTNDADDVLVQKTEYQYDAPVGGIEGYGGAEPPGHLSTYGTSWSTRGDLSGVTTWKDLAGNVSATRNIKFDKFGNTVKDQPSCCNEKNYTFGQSTYWSKPDQFMTGSPAGINLTDTAVYNFNDGSMASNTTPFGQTTEFTYDPFGRPTGVTLPTGASGTTSYNIWGLPTSSTFSYTEGTNKTLVVSTVYDGWGQAIQTVDKNGAQVNMSYDTLGRLVSRTNPFPQGGTPGPVTTYQYDVLGRLKVQTLPDGNKIKTDYTGAVITVTDQVKRKAKREVDSLGRLVKVTEQDAAGALSQETSYTYNVANRLTQVNQGGQLRSYKYDDEGHLLYERIPEQTATINDGTGTLWCTKYTYNSTGTVATKTDARSVITTYGYDSLNRLTSLTYNTSGSPGVATANNISYTYDNTIGSPTRGLLLSISMTGPDAPYTEAFNYDSLKRCSSRTWSRDGRSYTVSYLYNSANQRTRLVYPSGRIVDIAHDSKGRKTSIGSFLTSVSYSGIGQVTGATLGNGVTESFGYDSQRMQLTSQAATKGAATLMSLSYNYQAGAGQMGPGTGAGNADQLTGVTGSINGSTESMSFTYDLWRRLLTSSETTNGVAVDRRFAYDRWGNRTGVWDAASGGNQIQNVALQQAAGAPTNRIASVTAGGSTLSYAYDADGNLTNDGLHAYSYDAESRLVLVDGGSAAAVKYDYANRRVKKTAGGLTSHYVWDGSSVLAEYNVTTGALIAEYINHDDVTLAKIEGGSTRYLLRDRLSLRVTVDASGNVVGRQGHLPFGEPVGTSGEQDKHRFTTYENDGESGMDYAMNRYHASAVGRFATPDPSDQSYNYGNPQTLNRYSYVLNDPINRVDPSGLLTLIIGGALAGDPDWGQPGTEFWKSVSETFGEDAIVFEWSGLGFTALTGYAGILTAGLGLAIYINSYQFKDGEKLNIVAHSHGGNVVKVATTYILKHAIDNLITLGTPQNFDLPSIIRPAVRNYCNVSSFEDPIQFLGASPTQIGNTLLNFYWGVIATYNLWIALYFGDYWAAWRYSQAAAMYFGRAFLWYVSTKIDPLAANVVLWSESHGDLHTSRIWKKIQKPCGLR